ncbi:hypothetical protein ACFYTE_17290, partial [Streptomyces sp. NPDC004629]
RTHGPTAPPRPRPGPAGHRRIPTTLTHPTDRDDTEPVPARTSRPRQGADARVRTLTAHVPNTTPVPVVARLVRGVEGVVDVDCALMGPLRRPDLDPDLPDTAGFPPP